MSFRGRSLVQDRDKIGDFVCSCENREEEIGKASLLQFGVWDGGREGAGRGEEKTHVFGHLERAASRESMSSPIQAGRGALAAQVGSQQLEQSEVGAAFFPAERVIRAKHSSTDL